MSVHNSPDGSVHLASPASAAAAAVDPLLHSAASAHGSTPATAEQSEQIKQQNNNAQQQLQMQQQGNYAQQGNAGSSNNNNLSHGYPLSSSKQLLEQQQQRQQGSAQAQQQHYQSSNKNLVEHAKSGQQQQTMEGGGQQQQQSSTGGAPVHPSGVNTHYTPASSNNGNGSMGYSSNVPSPSLTISPHTGSPAGNSPYDSAGAIAPYTPEGMQQQSGQQYHSGQSQSQSQGGYSHSQHHQQNFAPSPHSSPVNQAFAQVLVAGLPLSLTQAELGDIFSSLPSYERCGIACDPATGLSIGRGWLVFASCDYANQAIAKMNGMSLAGNILSLSMMQPIGESTKSNIYVAGLPKQYTQVQLEQLFATFGTIIESKILMDPTGMSRGVAFVRYDNSNSAAQAITAVNGHVMADASHTYTIRVKFARDHHRNADPTLAMLTGTPSPNTPPSAQQSHAPRPAAIYQSYIPPHVKARGDEISGGVALFVFHIPAEFTSRDLQELFAPCATVLSARIAIHPQTLESKGFGFVTCASMEEAHQAVTLLNGRRVGRKFIKVSFKKQQTTAPGTPQQQQHMMQGGQPPQHQQPHQQQPMLQHSHSASHQQQAPHLQHSQQSQHQSQQSPHQRNPSLDINLSSLAAALSLSQNFNSMNQQTVNYPAQNSGGWNQSAVATPSSPSLLNYANGGNQSALPLHLLMQQMQLSQAFPSNYNSPQQSNQSSVQQQVHQQVSAQQGHHSAHGSYGGGNYSPSPSVGVQNSWLPASPINMPQSALNSNSVYHTNSNNYYSQQQPQQQQQPSHQNAPQTQSQHQQNQSQQHLFM